jgi:death-on-curing protein
MKPKFLKIDKIRQIHESVIRKYGGSLGIRDIGLLESAIAMPRASFGGEFLHEDLFAMAAAYLFHLVQNHPFIDGNKRVGGAAALAFLDLNGVEVIADEEAFADLVLAVAQSQADKEQIAAFLRRNTAG